MTKKLSPQEIAHFQDKIISFYRENRRDFPFRDCDDSYKVVVSEFMLQQTQTARVVPFFERFVERFPTVQSLALAPLSEVLILWQGLGYNRRAKFLKNAADAVVERFNGKFPQTEEELQSLPGIGSYTAAAIIAFAFNKPVVIVETNIRALFIHLFFEAGETVADSALIPLVEQTLPKDNIREWYYALMDYGVEIKKKHKNPSRRSKHHVKQSAFVGSDRQKRGVLLRELIKNETLTADELCTLLKCDPKKAEKVAGSLEKEGLIVREGTKIYLPK